MPREITIYGIREVGTTNVIYVGATVDIKSRHRSGWSPAVTEAMSKIDWEYVTLDVCDIHDQVKCEQSHIDRLLLGGHRLLNNHKAARTKAFVDESLLVSRLHGTWSEERYRNSGLVSTKLRISAGTRQYLEYLAFVSGSGMSAVVQKLVEREKEKYFYTEMP